MKQMIHTPHVLRSRQSAIRLLGVALGISLLAALLWWQLPGTLVQAGTCTAGTAISETFGTGARWDLCWAERRNEGIVLSEIYYSPPNGTPRKVLQEASLSQIEVHYDDGHTALYHAGTPGLGGKQLLTLEAADCPAGTLLGNGVRALLCQQVGPRGYLYKYYSVQKQGEALALFSISEIGQMTYIVQWRFFDDGTIEPTVGEGGRLWRIGQDARYGLPTNVDGAGETAIGIGYVTNYWWRLDFDLANNGANDYVDEFTVDAQNGNRELVTTVTELTSESARSTDPDRKRSWRVRDGSVTNSDGHAVSYHLEPKQAGYRYVGPASEPWSANDLYVTVDQGCEHLPIRNDAAHLEDTPCGNHVADYVNGEAINGADVVLWYRVTTRRLPRIEDTPLLGVQWHGYQLLPRDWTAQNPF